MERASPRQGSGLLAPTTLQPASAHTVSRRLLKRARRLHEEGVAPFHFLRSGLPCLDARRLSWWGCVTLTGPSGIGMSALACALAQETAATGHRVLWCCLRGESELAALGMLTKGAGIDLRRVMVTRDLGANDWRALEAAAARLARIPLHFVDAHGADLAELRRLATALTTRQREPAHRLELVVLDGLEAPDAPALRGLEQIAEDLEVPILAVFSRPRGWCGAGLPLRRGTLALRLDEAREGGQETSYRARWPALRLVVSGSAGARS